MIRVPSWLPLAVLVACIGSLATPPRARAQSITGYDWNEPVTLKLRDGRQIEGRYRGVLGAPDSDTPYSERYAAWRNETSPELGETLDVALKSGDTMSGTFHGFTDAAVLLGTADSCVLLMLTFKQIRGVHLGHERPADPGWAALKKSWKSAPSLCVIALQSDGLNQAVPVSMVVRQAPKHNSGNDVVGGVVAGVLVGAVITGIAMAAAMASMFSHALI